MKGVARKKSLIGIIGTSQPDDNLAKIAEEVGREVAQQGAVLVCGGLGGVMEYAAKGAKKNQGLTIGVLPTETTSSANNYIDVPIATGMGEARNIIIVKSSNVLIAIGKGFGTLSEIAFALKLGKPVIGLDTWELAPQVKEIPAIIPAKTPKEAVEKAIELISQS